MDKRDNGYRKSNGSVPIDLYISSNDTDPFDSFVAEEVGGQVGLIYVVMTRAKSQLLITASCEPDFTQRMVEMVAP